jgi:hypothetical protein
MLEQLYLKFGQRDAKSEIIIGVVNIKGIILLKGDGGIVEGVQKQPHSLRKWD